MGAPIPALIVQRGGYYNHGDIVYQYRGNVHNSVVLYRHTQLYSYTVITVIQLDTHSVVQCGPITRAPGCGGGTLLAGPVLHSFAAVTAAREAMRNNEVTALDETSFIQEAAFDIREGKGGGATGVGFTDASPRPRLHFRPSFLELLHFD